MPGEKKRQRQPDSRNSEISYAALRELDQSDQLPVVHHLSLKWLKKQISYAFHPVILRESTPKEIKESIPEKLLPYLHIITFIYYPEKAVKKERIHGQFLTAITRQERHSVVFKSRRDKSVFLSALKVARGTVCGKYLDAKKKPMKKRPRTNELNFAVDTILSDLWDLKFKNPTKYFSELLRKSQNEEPAKSRKKNILESPQNMRRKLTKLAEQVLVTQVSSSSFIFIDNSLISVSQNLFTRSFFQIKEREAKQLGVEKSRAVDFLKVAILRLHRFYTRNNLVPTEEDAKIALQGLRVDDEIFFSSCFNDILNFHKTFGKKLMISKKYMKKFFSSYNVVHVASKGPKRYTFDELRPRLMEFHIKLMLLVLSRKINIKWCFNGDETPNYPLGSPEAVVTIRGSNVSVESDGNDKYRFTHTLGVGSDNTMMDGLITFSSAGKSKLDVIEKMELVREGSAPFTRFRKTKTLSIKEQIRLTGLGEVKHADGYDAIALSDVMKRVQQLTPDERKNPEELKKGIFPETVDNGAHVDKFTTQTNETVSRNLRSRSSKLQKTMENTAVASGVDAEVDILASRQDGRGRSGSERVRLPNSAPPITTSQVKPESGLRTHRTRKTSTTQVVPDRGSIITYESIVDPAAVASASESLSAKNLSSESAEAMVTGVSRDPEMHALLNAKPIPANELLMFRGLCEELRGLMSIEFQRECKSTASCSPVTDVLYVTYQEAAWSCQRIFLVWLEFCLYPKIKDNLAEALVLVDNFPGHVTDDVKRYCFHRGINIMFLPAYTTPYSQPVDIGCNKPSTTGQEACRNFKNPYFKMRKGKFVCADKRGYSLLVAHAGSAAITESTICNSFHHMFVYPDASTTEKEVLKKTLTKSDEK